MSAEVTEKPRRLLISGASGMLGAALHRALAEKRIEVTRLVRREPAGPGEVRWDPTAPSPFHDLRALEGVSAVIHLSGANLAARRWTAAYRREIWSSRVDSTRALAAALAGLEQRPVSFLAASAIGIYGDRGDEIVDESSAPGSGFLADLCAAWETAAQPAVAAGIRVLHLRFGVVLDRRAGALAKMVPLFRLGLGGRLGSGKQWISWISLPDLVNATIFALDTTCLSGPVNLISPQPVTNAEFTRALARILHRPVGPPAPAFALRLALGPMADEALLSSTRALPRRLLETGFQFAHANIDDALAEALKP